MSKSIQQPVAVIGLGAVMPDANSLKTFWDNIVNGKDSIREVPADRWRVDDFYDPDPSAPDKTYSKIGAFVSDFHFDSLAFRIPPRVAAAMDDVQKWTVVACQEALVDAGYQSKEFDRQRTAVVIGNSLSGELQHFTNMRVQVPRFLRALKSTRTYSALPADKSSSLLDEFRACLLEGLPPISEDSMPGELSNVIAGRVANVFDLRGPNFTTDAACASAMAALEAAVNGLNERRYDLVLTGGVDSSMSPHTFVKFAKIGALSADRSCPFDQRANGFVMGEGCGILLLKRLEDAERDQDRIYAVIRGIGCSSDGRGKGITAPNPVGQKLAMERAYQNSGMSPAEVSYLEAHGTSTSVGDLVEATVANEMFTAAGAPNNGIAMGSVKSQIGHLKSAAGGASLIKTCMAIHHAVIPGSLHFEQPNPKIPFGNSPIYVPETTRSWKTQNDRPRVAGVSSFGFGGTNFHAVLSEYRVGENRPKAFVPSTSAKTAGVAGPAGLSVTTASGSKHRMLLVGGQNRAELAGALAQQLNQPREGDLQPGADGPSSMPERLAICHEADSDRQVKGKMALAALEKDEPATWRALAGKGIYRSLGPAGKVAFLFPGQGSQYINMLKTLREEEAVVRETFAEADQIMRPQMQRPLSDYIFTEDNEANNLALRDTNICQPAVLAADVALARLLMQRGVMPDLVAGHSLGEYAALVVSGMLSFSNALLAVSARAKEMSGVRVDDPGKMVAVFAPLAKVQEVIASIPQAVIANYNSRNQVVLGGTTAAIAAVAKKFEELEIKAVELNVSHAFHSYIVAPAVEPLHRVLQRLDFRPPQIPLIANVDAQPYDPAVSAVSANIERLSRQVAAPVRFIEILESLYQRGVRMFVEVGPKRVLSNFVLDVVADPWVLAVATNQPKLGDMGSLSYALSACSAAGSVQESVLASKPEGSMIIENHQEPKSLSQAQESQPQRDTPVVISGISLGLPGIDHELFAEDNPQRLLSGKIGIDPVSLPERQRMAGQRIVRLVKDAPGGPAFEVIDHPDQVAQLTGRKGTFDLATEFGLDPERVQSFDITTKLAVAAGLLALRDAGIPLTMRQRLTTTGKKFPLGWRLPETLADETGVIFASAFPGIDELIKEMDRRNQDEILEARLAELQYLSEVVGSLNFVKQRMVELQQQRQEAYHLDRKFIFRSLALGHAQLAELIGARGPNVCLNGACASTTQGVILASDWIRAGRCRRVLVVGADDITNPNLAPWFVGGLLATGAVTTEGELERAALPFDRRRNGMIPGMGAVGLVVEQEELLAQRGQRGVVRMLGSVMANSAHHVARLDVEHVGATMEKLIRQVEQNHGLDRRQLASKLMFVSHETYTPARGGSASAEVHALRRVFGKDVDKIVIANTKGLTGHPMGVGIEDSALVHMLEQQTIPPIANFKEQDPELGPINLSKGGHYDVRYALRLAAGFGSQLAMTMFERVDSANGRILDPARHQAWLEQMAGFASTRLEVVSKTLRLVDATNAQTDVDKSVIASKIAVQVQQAPVVMQVAALPKRDDSATTPSLAQVRPPFVEPPVRAISNWDAKGVESKILGIVAQKTGYPPQMLELDLDLEADLGIDTVKQAEMFAEIRSTFGIAKQEDLKLSEYNTLAKVIQFALGKMPQAGSASATSAASATAQTVLPTPEVSQPVVAASTVAATAAVAAQTPVAAAAEPPKTSKTMDAKEVEGKILSIVAQKTGYPPQMLELDLDLEADLGIDTVKQAEMFAEIRSTFGIAKQEDLKLSEYNTLAKVIQFALGKMNQAGSAPATSAASATAQTALPTSEVSQPVVAASTVAATAAVAAQTPVAAAAEPPKTSKTMDAKEVEGKILSIVAQKTGYPPQMLELDLDLEADLGIDTVKQAEMFAEIRSTFGIAKQEDLKLSEYNTLAKVIQFALSKMGTVSATTQPGLPAPAQEKAMAAADSHAVSPLPVDELLAGAPMASEVTRVLRPFLVERPSIEQCLPTGARVNGLSFVIGDYAATAAALVAEIQHRGGRVISVRSDADPDAVAAQVERLANVEAPDGVWYLPGLSDAAKPGSGDSTLWKRALDERARLPFRIAKVLDGALKDRPGSFFLCATRMGGQCGLGLDGAADFAAGALCGLVKSIAQEWPSVLCKVVDFPVDASGHQIARALMAEAERDRGVVEIGQCHDGRFGVGLTTVGLPETDKATADAGQLPQKPVVLITGGAGDIVGQIVADLANTCGGTYYLGDLLAPREQDQQDIAALQADREGFKALLIERLKARGERVTPVLIDRSLREVERRAAMAESVRTITQFQAAAIPVAFDVTDPAAVSKVVNQILEKHGRLDWILHAAGLEHSQGIARKSPESFDRIFGVKAEGLHALLQATQQVSTTRLVLFGSVAGRFGNAGQTDYSAANDLLAKFAQSATRFRSGLSAVTLDFSGWEGRGMATRGSVPEQLARAGITLIPIAEGASLVRRALASGRSGELVVARSLGVLFDGLRAQGADLDILNRRLAQHPDRYPLLGKVLDWTLLDGLRLEVMFDPAHDSYLNDHRIDGTVVLPGVMAVETFAEAARLLQPDMEVISVEDLAFEAPLKLYRDEPRQATVRLIQTLHGRERVWLASMETTRSLVGGKQQTTRHFRARIRLDRQASSVKGELPSGNGNSKVLGRQAIYQAYFHGPSFQVLEKVTTTEDGQLAGWMDLSRQKPPLARTGCLIAQPMLTELAFQAAGIAEMHTHARMGLPAGVKNLKIHTSPAGEHGRIAAKVVSQRQGESTIYGVKVVDERGFVLVELEGYRTSPLPNSLPGNLQQLLGGHGKSSDNKLVKT